MSKITTVGKENTRRIGIDLARRVMQVHGASSSGRILWRKRVYPNELLELLRQYKGCEVGLEACSGSNYWGREISKLGHEVKLIAPQYVKPFVKRNKNDSADADAILEALSRPEMRFVPVKSVEQQEMGHLHRAREVLVRQRTALVNEIKGILNEFGVVLSSGRRKLYGEYVESLERHKSRLGEVTLRLMERLFQQLRELEKSVKEHEKEIEELFKGNELCQRIATIGGVGILTATAVVAASAGGRQYKNGREFSASLGLVPSQYSSGNTQRLGRISKRGNSYLRKLLVQGGHNVVRYAEKDTSARGKWVRGIVERGGKQKAAVAVANKNARIIWAIMVHGGSYDSSYSAKKSVQPEQIAA